MMKTWTFALTLTFAVLAGTTGAAEPDHRMTQQQMAAQAASTAEGSGIIKELDAAGSRVKIAHGPINALHWPPMTMWFAVRGTLPQNIKTGDRVRFVLQQTAPDEWVISRLELQH